MKVNVGHIGSCAVALFAGLWGTASIAQAEGAVQEPVVHMPMMDFDHSFRIMGQTDATSDSTCIGKMISPLCAFETSFAATWREDWQLQDIALGRVDPKDRKPFQVGKIYIPKVAYRITSIRQYRLVPAPQYNEYKMQPWDVAIYYETCNATYGPCTKGDIGDDGSALFRQGKYGWHLVPGIGFRMDATNPHQTSSEGW